MIKTILWDIDGTILNFQSAAENSLKNTFKKFGYGEITDELLHMYEGINDVYWCKLEKGEITKEKLQKRNYNKENSSLKRKGF